MTLSLPEFSSQTNEAIKHLVSPLRNVIVHVICYSHWQQSFSKQAGSSNEWFCSSRAFLFALCFLRTPNPCPLFSRILTTGTCTHHLGINTTNPQFCLIMQKSPIFWLNNCILEQKYFCLCTVDYETRSSYIFTPLLLTDIIHACFIDLQEQSQVFATFGDNYSRIQLDIATKYRATAFLRCFKSLTMLLLTTWQCCNWVCNPVAPTG